MIVVGVDENGLGPILGPLVTTAVSFELARYSAGRHATLGRSLGIDDSKTTASFGHMERAESFALALFESLHGRLPGDVDTLFEGLLLDSPTALQRPCPTGSHPQCWSAALALPCFGGDVQVGRDMLAALAKKRVHVVRAKSAVACTSHLNTRLSQGQSRVEVDLELMERLVLDARAQVAGEVRAICGMVGGIRDYLPKLRHLNAHKVVASRPLRGQIGYEVESVGHVCFEIDADATHLPVALASMVGKYVRELWMTRQNRFYRARDEALEDVSGYHDPVTQRFVRASKALRVVLGIHDDCFVRKAAKDMPVEVADPNQLVLL